MSTLHSYSQVKRTAEDYPYKYRKRLEHIDATYESGISSDDSYTVKSALPSHIHIKPNMKNVAVQTMKTNKDREIKEL